MPILNVDQSAAVVVLKRSMNTGFAGIENELFFDPKTSMLFGDAKASVSEPRRRRQGAVGPAAGDGPRSGPPPDGPEATRSVLGRHRERGRPSRTRRRPRRSPRSSVSQRPIDVPLWWSMNSSTTMTAVNALAARIAIGSENGSSGGLGMNSSTAPASITSEPSTASLPIAFDVPCVEALRDRPEPREGDAERVPVEDQRADQGSNRAADHHPLAARDLRPVHSHTPCEDDERKPAPRSSHRRRILSSLQACKQRRQQGGALADRLERHALVDRVGARAGRPEAVDHGGADRGREVAVRAARRGVLAELDAGLGGDRDRAPGELCRRPATAPSAAG